MNVPLQSDLDRAVTGRDGSFFDRDCSARAEELSSAIRRRRILVVGGGGSIGSATARALIPFQPAALHVIDVSENYLAELIREVRSGPLDLGGVELQTHVFDYASPTMHRFLSATPTFDVVLNFAAVKHVRSEKDVYSLLHMLDVNVVRQARFKTWLAARKGNPRFFTVSTDKAANPVSLMGASKRVMEDVAFDILPATFPVTSARFANVAFSNGSLLQSFLTRIEKRQPLAVPRETRRYFISHREAAEICLLASLLAPDRHIAIPAFEPAEHLTLLEDVAVRVLEQYGYDAWFTDDEMAAKRHLLGENKGRRWPVLRTPLDTSGEKSYEEFVGVGERALDIGFTSLLGIKHLPAAALDGFLRELERIVEDGNCPVDKVSLTRMIEAMVPNMRHAETGRNLDQRM